MTEKEQDRVLRPLQLTRSVYNPADATAIGVSKVNNDARWSHKGLPITRGFIEEVEKP